MLLNPEINLKKMAVLHANSPEFLNPWTWYKSLCLSPLKFLYSILWFLVLRSYVIGGKFVLNSLSLLWHYKWHLKFLFFCCLLLIEIQLLLYVDLVPCDFTEFIYLSILKFYCAFLRIFCVNSHVIYKWFHFFSNFYAFYFIFLCFSLASSTVVGGSDESGQPACVWPEGKAVSISPLNLMLAPDFSQMPFITIRKFSFIPSLLRVCILNEC